MKKHWVVAEKMPPDFQELFSSLPTLALQVLYNRGVHSQDMLEAYLHPNYEKQSHDPFLFDDMERAVSRIITALKNSEQIMIYGDYDVDGICASTILYDTLILLKGSVDLYMNHREKDGYGLQKKGIDFIAEKKATLIITNDSGISNKAEVAHANALGIDVIITDHHTVPTRKEDLPPAYAIIHPLVNADNYPFKHLSGTGSAFKLVQGIIHASFDPWLIARRTQACQIDGRAVNWEGFEKWLLDVVSIATIADCMPLLGENRMFVHYGLRVLEKTRRNGLRALITNAGKQSKKMDVKTINFFIAPRLNAASRMEHGVLGFQLLTTQKEEEAHSLAGRLEQANKDRQKLTERVFTDAKKQLKPLYDRGAKALVGKGSDWPLGVLGLVAGKLCSFFHRPVILATEAHGDHIGGTVRSIEGFHASQSLIALSSFFIRHGGHAAAGGFALKKDVSFPLFRKVYEEYAETILVADQLIQTLTIDSAARLSDITWDVMNVLDQCEPFGTGNARPRFLFSNVSICACTPVGSKGNHLRLMIDDNGVKRTCIGFSFGSFATTLSLGDRINLVCELEKNEWGGRKELQLNIIDLELCETMAVSH